VSNEEEDQPGSPEDPGPRWLRTHGTRGLAKTSARSGASTLGGQGINTIVQFGATAVLARLLAPEAFGLVAMVTSLSFLVNVFKDFGVGQAIVQREHLRPRHVHGVFWWSVVASLVTLGVFVVLAPVVVAFYGEPPLLKIAWAIGLATTLQSLAAVPQALLRRRMKFGTIAAQNVLAVLFGAAAAIAVAAIGGGYWALVTQVMVNAAAQLTMLWFASGYVPSAVNAWLESWPLLSFGLQNSGARLFSQASRSCDNIIIGKVAGDAILGQYAVAYRILMLPITQFTGPVTQVAIPALSRLQSEPERYRRFYRHALLLVTSVGMPVVVLVTLLIGALIPLFLGEGWDQAVVLFRILSIYAFAGTFNVASGWAFISCGQVTRQLQWTTSFAIVHVLSMLIGSFWGAVGVAVAASLIGAAGMVVGLIYCYRFTIPSFRDFLRSVYRPALASTGAGGLVLVYLAVMNPEGLGAFDIGVTAVVYGIVYALTWIALPGGPHAASMVWTTVCMLGPTRAGKNTPEPRGRYASGEQ